jgi:hypothetical protein
MAFAWKEKGAGFSRRLGRVSKYQTYWASKEEQLLQLIKGEVEAIDVKDIASISPEKKNWTGSVSFTRTSFAYGNMAPVVAAAKATQKLLPEGDETRYVVRITSYGELVLSKPDTETKPKDSVVVKKTTKATPKADQPNAQ